MARAHGATLATRRTPSPPPLPPPATRRLSTPPTRRSSASRRPRSRPPSRFSQQRAAMRMPWRRRRLRFFTRPHLPSSLPVSRSPPRTPPPPLRIRSRALPASAPAWHPSSAHAVPPASVAPQVPSAPPPWMMAFMQMMMQGPPGGQWQPGGMGGPNYPFAPSAAAIPRNDTDGSGGASAPGSAKHSRCASALGGHAGGDPLADANDMQAVAEAQAAAPGLCSPAALAGWSGGPGGHGSSGSMGRRVSCIDHSNLHATGIPVCGLGVAGSQMAAMMDERRNFTMAASQGVPPVRPRSRALSAATRATMTPWPHRLDRQMAAQHRPCVATPLSPRRSRASASAARRRRGRRASRSRSRRAI